MRRLLSVIQLLALLARAYAQCAAGYTGPDAGPCVLCVAGKYKTATGSAACTDCTAGFTSGVGSTDVLDCCNPNTLFVKNLFHSLSTATQTKLYNQNDVRVSSIPVLGLTTTVATVAPVLTSNGFNGQSYLKFSKILSPLGDFKYLAGVGGNVLFSSGLTIVTVVRFTQNMRTTLLSHQRQNEFVGFEVLRSNGLQFCVCGLTGGNGCSNICTTAAMPNDVWLQVSYTYNPNIVNKQVLKVNYSNPSPVFLTTTSTTAFINHDQPRKAGFGFSASTDCTGNANSFVPRPENYGNGCDRGTFDLAGFYLFEALASDSDIGIIFQAIAAGSNIAYDRTTACLCNAGYGGTGRSDCPSCAPGTYKSEVKSIPCSLCAANTYSTAVTATHISTCTACPVDTGSFCSGCSSFDGCTCKFAFYGPVGGPCTACPANSGSTCTGNCFLSTNCACNVGFTGPNGNPCVACVAGTYKTTTGSMACTNCTAGTYSTTTNATIATVCLACPVTTYSATLGARNITSCLACPANTNSPTSSPAITSCICNAGYTGPNGGPCTPCVAGTYKLGTGPALCTNCAAGTYSITTAATVATVCVACALNRISGVSATNINQCVCNAGYTHHGMVDLLRMCGTTFPSRCIPVKEVNKDGTISTPALNGCNDGNYNTAGGTMGQDKATGEYVIDFDLGVERRVDMVVAFFEESLYQTYFKDLYYSVRVGNQSNAYVSGAISLFTPANINTKMCPDQRLIDNNQYMQVSGAGATFFRRVTFACSNPIFGRYFTFVKKLGDSTFISMHELQVLGYLSTNTSVSDDLAYAQECSVCAAGKYKGSVGTLACTDCASNAGASCAGCIAATGCLCNPGFYGPNGGPCTACANNSGASCSGCTTAVSCTCNVGYTGPNGGPCRPCVAGTYKIATGSAVCTNCAAGTYSNATAATIATVCLACAVAKYSATLGAPNITSCLECPANTNSSISSPAVTSCICNPGYTGPNGGVCWMCNPGTYKTATGSAACTDCAAGKYSTAFAATLVATCVNCPANSGSSCSGCYVSACSCNAGYVGGYFLSSYSTTVCTRFNALILSKTSFASVSTRNNSAVGSAILPTYSAAGGPNGYGHVSFDRTNSQYLTSNTGSRAFNLRTNGGFTVLLVVQFTGTLVSQERIMSMWSGTNTFEMAVGRYGSTSQIQFGICNAGSGCLYPYAGPILAQNTWGTIKITYSSKTLFFDFNVNGVGGLWDMGSSWTDKSITGIKLGAVEGTPVTQFLTGNIAAAFVVDEWLSATATTEIVNMMLSGTDPTNFVCGNVTNCTACPSGQYKSVSGSSACVSCSAGTYVATVAATACVACPANSGASCSGCSALAGCTCNVGYYGLNGGTCTACPANSGASCSGCTALASCTCNAGFYGPNGGTCTTCPANTGASCSGCTASTSCTCNVGYTGPNGGPCALCAVGTYKNTTGNVSCTSCPAGGNSSLPGTDSLQKCCESNSLASCGTLRNWARSCGTSGITACAAVSSSTYAGYSAANVNDGNYDTAYISACCGGVTDWWRVDFSTIRAITFVRIYGHGYKPESLSNFNIQLSNDGVTFTNCATGQNAARTAPLVSDHICVGSAQFLRISMYTANPIYLQINEVEVYSDCMSVRECLCNAGYTGNATGANMGICTTCATGTYKNKTGSALCTGCPAGSFSTSTNPEVAPSCVACPANAGASCSACTASTNCTCNVGYTGPNGGPCAACLPGTSKITTGSANCTVCTAGTFSTAAGASTCSACGANSGASCSGCTALASCRCNPGFYGPNGGPCTACPANGGASCSGCTALASCTCNPGFYGPNGGTCTACPANSGASCSGCTALASCRCNPGFYGPNGGTCTACPANAGASCSGCTALASCTCNPGFYGPNGGTCTTCPANSGVSCTGNGNCRAIADCTCNLGFTGPNGTNCTACIAGKYKNTTGSSACQSCQQNATSSIGSVSQAYCYCQSGYAHATDPNTCLICNPGTYNSRVGHYTCSNCSLGFYSPHFGAVSNETCLACPLDQWSPEGSPSCNLCPLNSRAPAGSGSQTNCTCDAGYSGANGGICTACVAGTYKSATGSDACIECPAGQTSPIASSSSAACIFAVCGPGYTGPDGAPCTACAAGTYKDTTGSAACTACGFGKYSLLAAGACIDCGAGYYTTATGTSTSFNCIKCSAGKYASTTGNNITACIPCAAGTSSVPTGSTSIDNCIPCIVGRYGQSTGRNTCQICPAGKYSPTTGSTGCTDCAAGKYSPVTQQSAEAACIACGITYSSPIGSSSIGACVCDTGYTGPDGGVCVLCAAGKYKNNTGNVNCTDCGTGTYSTTAGATVATTCLACPSGSTSSVASSSSFSCVCNAGYTGPDGICSPCAAGLYKTTTGSDACVACPADSSSPSQSQAATACTCNAGYSGADGDACVACPAGSYKDATGSAACTSCPAFSGATCALCVDSALCVCTAYTGDTCTACVAASAPASTVADACVCGPGLYDASLG